MYSGVFIAEEVFETGDKWSGNSKTVKVQTSQKAFLNISPLQKKDLPFSMIKFFFG